MEARRGEGRLMKTMPGDGGGRDDGPGGKEKWARIKRKDNRNGV